jgi:hypothetical protein
MTRIGSQRHRKERKKERISLTKSTCCSLGVIFLYKFMQVISDFCWTMGLCAAISLGLMKMCYTDQSYTAYDSTSGWTNTCSLVELHFVKKKICIPRSFLVINVCNQGKNLWSPCIVDRGINSDSVAHLKLYTSATRFVIKVQKVEQRYSSTLSLTSAPDGGGCSTPRPDRFTPAKKTRYTMYRRLSGPQGRPGRVRKTPPLRGFFFCPKVLLFYSVYVLHLFSRWTTWVTEIAQLVLLLLLYIIHSVGKTLCSLVSSY